MKLYYYKDAKGNFGDDLNLWLWKQLIQVPFDNNNNELFVGIGTLLNDKLPKEPTKHIFGTGAGYGNIPIIDRTFNFYAVRGPLTAAKLGIESKLALTDPAILIRVIQNLNLHSLKSHKFGFIPHHISNFNFNWATVCERLGFKFIDVAWSVDKFMYEMSSCEILLCEAMHGAIIADALRIPWIPIKCYAHINSFKWEDWLKTVNLDYKPISIQPIFDQERFMNYSAFFKNRIKLLLKKVGLFSSYWDQPYKKRTEGILIDKAIVQLLSLKNEKYYLSSTETCNNLTDRYISLLHRFNMKITG